MSSSSTKTNFEGRSGKSSAEMISDSSSVNYPVNSGTKTLAFS